MIVLLNQASGAASGRDLEERLRQSLPGAQIVRVAQGAPVTDLAREAVERGERVIVAGGGDGTVNSVAAALADSPAALGVLPLGTLNHFAKDLGLPLDLEGAVQILLAGNTRRVDVGEVNGRVFVNNSSMGLYPHIVAGRRAWQRRGWSKWTALAWAMAAALRRYPFLTVRIDADGQPLARTTPFVFIGNNEYRMEGLRLGSRVRLDGGRLWLYSAPHKPSRLYLAHLAVRALLGGLRQERDFYAAPAREIWVETRRRRITVALDGELAHLETPLHYRVRPRALWVIAPPEES